MMRPNLYTKKQKNLRKMYKEYMDLIVNRRGVTVPVEPYQKGWVRTFALKDEVYLRPDYIAISDAFEIVNDKQWSPNKDFTVRVGKGRYEEMSFRTKVIPLRAKEERPGEIPEHLLKYFNIQEFLSWDKTYYKAYDFVGKNWLKVEVYPNIITHQFIPDGEAESRKDYLHKVLFESGEYGELFKVFGWSSGPRDPTFDKYTLNTEDYDYEE